MRHRTALVLAMVFPLGMAILDFVVLPNAEGRQNLTMQIVAGLGKVVQFSFPLLYLFWFDRSQLRLSRPSTRGLALGLVFGLGTALIALGLYFFVLKETGPFTAMGPKVQTFLKQIGLNTIGKYIGLALFYSLVHSLGEEYYWRWFVFGQLRRSLGWVWAAVISSLAFMSHHVILLHHYMPGYFWSGVVPLSLGVAVGGMVWAWIYQRSQSIYAVWASHALVDAAIMIVGYALLN